MSGARGMAEAETAARSATHAATIGTSRHAALGTTQRGYAPADRSVKRNGLQR